MKKKQSKPVNLWTRVSHDLRQPIQSLLLLSHVVAMTDDRAQRQAAARSMEDSLLALQAMIENLAAVAKLDAGTIKPVAAPTALGPLVATMAAAAAGIVNDPHLKIETHVEPVTIATDRLMLGTLVSWLAVNVAHLARAASRTDARSRVIEFRCCLIDGVAHVECHYIGAAPTVTQLNALFVEVTASGSATPSARVVPGLGFLTTYAEHIATELKTATHLIDKQVISLKIHALKTGASAAGTPPSRLGDGRGKN